MCPNEWLKLIIPVLIAAVCDAAILLFIQYSILNRLERKNSNDQLKNEVYRNNINLIEKTLLSSRALDSAIANKCENKNATINNISNALNQLRNDVRNLYYFYEDYSVIIDEDSNCKRMYIELNERFVYVIENWDNNGGNAILDFIKDCDLLLHNLMDSTLKHIYNIKD